MKNYKYGITYAYATMKTHERDEGGYLHWLLKDHERGLKFEIHTNLNGDGLFAWNNAQGCYRQLSGTCQFSMPGASREACRLKLKALYEAELAEHEDNPLRSPFIERMKKAW